MRRGIKLRDIGADDCVALTAIRQDPLLLDNLMSYPDTDPVSDAEACKWIERKVTDENSILLIVADEADTCLGYVQITGMHFRGGYAWFGIAIASSAQGKGAGRQAMTTLISYASGTLGLRKIMCEVRADNGPAISLYEALGFETVGTYKLHYRDLNSTFHNVLIMERILS